MAAALSLFAAICSERHEASQDAVRARVSLWVILAALRDTTLPYEIRACFVHVLVNAYVDFEPLEDLTEVHSRAWHNLDDPRALDAARDHIEKKHRIKGPDGVEVDGHAEIIESTWKRTLQHCSGWTATRLWRSPRMQSGPRPTRNWQRPPAMRCAGTP
eukprot:m.262655 g.262655  ORF g.262655 m.262655 type:complete len:159 (-) comp25662_c0_seq1:543-1019(-)